MKKLLLSSFFLTFLLTNIICAASSNLTESVIQQATIAEATPAENGFLGMWTIDIEGGGVGWLEVHEKQEFLDANLMWVGGSVTPVSHVYLKDENTLIVTRTAQRKKGKDANGKERIHTMTFTLTAKRIGNNLVGEMIGPKWNGSGQNQTAFVGRRLPDVPNAPTLTKIKYGKTIQLLNGKDLSGWRLINPKHKNGFKILDGILVNDPVQPQDGEHLHYGNLRTELEFNDFNLQLEVNVPKGNNSGIYLMRTKS